MEKMKSEEREFKEKSTSTGTILLPSQNPFRTLISYKKNIGSSVGVLQGFF